MRKTLSALLLTAAAGCSAQRPTAQVAEVRVDEATSEGSRLIVAVALQNTREDPLPIRQTRYTLTVDDKTFEFTDLSAATMPASGAQTLQLPAAVRVPAGAIGNRPYELRGSVMYEPPGEIRDLLTDSGVPLPSVSFSQTGRLPAAPPLEPSPPPAPQEP